jgi:CheY-like chemotaxis protein
MERSISDRNCAADPASFGLIAPIPDLTQDAGQSPRVLLAEDVDVNRELIRLVLEAQGYQVDDVRDGEGALAAVMARHYDVILMDLQMPVMDGQQATRALRALGGRFRDIPVIALSANATAQQIELCLDAGMTAHLAKPFTSQSLRDTVARWTGRSMEPQAALIAALVRQSGQDRVEHLLGLLLTQLETFAACDAGDRRRLQALAHALGGSASLFGFSALAKASRALEDCCRSSQPPDAPFDEAKRLVALAHQELTRLLSPDARTQAATGPQA